MIFESVKSLYQTTSYNDILIDIDNLPVPFDPRWSNIAVSVSGGADSALLTYLLSNIIKEYNFDVKIHIISHTRCWKTRPWQRSNSLDVYNWMKNKFSDLQFIRHENFIPPDFEWGNKGPTIVDEYGQLNSGDIIEIRAFAEYICFKENIDAYFNAVTHNPEIKLEGAMERRNIEPKKENIDKMIKQHMGLLSCHPFRFVDKSWVYKQYKRLDILDLFSITRSCEGEFQDIDYRTYKPGQYVPVCGECFWCRERSWAESQ